MMNRFTLILASLLTVFVLMFTTAPALAAYNFFQRTCDTGTSSSSVCNDAQSGANQKPDNNKLYGPNGVITKIISLLAFVIGIVAVIVIIVAGIRFITSGGDATKVATAKSTILFAVVGLVVAALAQSIVIFVLKKI